MWVSGSSALVPLVGLWKTCIGDVRSFRTLVVRGTLQCILLDQMLMATWGLGPWDANGSLPLPNVSIKIEFKTPSRRDFQFGT